MTQCSSFFLLTDSQGHTPTLRHYLQTKYLFLVSPSDVWRVRTSGEVRCKRAENWEEVHTLVRQERDTDEHSCFKNLHPTRQSVKRAKQSQDTKCITIQTSFVKIHGNTER